MRRRAWSPDEQHRKQCKVVIEALPVSIFLFRGVAPDRGAFFWASGQRVPRLPQPNPSPPQPSRSSSTFSSPPCPLPFQARRRAPPSGHPRRRRTRRPDSSHRG